jgi:hypothetical protein
LMAWQLQMASISSALNVAEAECIIYLWRRL